MPTEFVLNYPDRSNRVLVIDVLDLPADVKRMIDLVRDCYLEDRCLHNLLAYYLLSWDNPATYYRTNSTLQLNIDQVSKPVDLLIEEVNQELRQRLEEEELFVGSLQSQGIGLDSINSKRIEMFRNLCQPFVDIYDPAFLK